MIDVFLWVVKVDGEIIKEVVSFLVGDKKKECDFLEDYGLEKEKEKETER